MSDIDEDEADARVRRRRLALSNTAVLAFVWRQWMRRPRAFWAGVTLTLIGVGFDMSLPWAAGRLVDAATVKPALGVQTAWGAWGVFVIVYVGVAAARNSFGWIWNVFAARNMEEMTHDAFARVQSFSSDWHANSFAGATVRRVSRAMWGYDSASDSLVVWLGQTVLVLIGLCVVMLVRWPSVGLFASLMCLAFAALNLVFDRALCQTSKSEVQRLGQPDRRGSGRRHHRQHRGQELWRRSARDRAASGRSGGLAGGGDPHLGSVSDGVAGAEHPFDPLAGRPDRAGGPRMDPRRRNPGRCRLRHQRLPADGRLSAQLRRECAHPSARSG